MQLNAGLFLQVTDYAEEVARLRIAARAEHPNEAFRLCASRRAELLKTDRRFDVIAKDRLAGVDIASMVSIPSRSSASAKAGSRAVRFCTGSFHHAAALPTGIDAARIQILHQGVTVPEAGAACARGLRA